jgi:hypothetical protein
MSKLFLTLFITLALLLASCDTMQDSDNSASELNNYEVLKTRDEVTEGDFIYRLVTEKGEYLNNESVNIFAELEYIGDKKAITIFHAASPFHFPMVEKTRNFSMDYPMKEPLLSTTLIKGKPLREEYTRSGGYGSQDEKEYVNFMKRFLKNGFPIGYYVVSGSAEFYVESKENGKQDKKAFKIKAQVDFKVKCCQKGQKDEDIEDSYNKLIVLKRDGSDNELEIHKEISDVKSVSKVQEIVNVEYWKKAKITMTRPPDYQILFEPTDGREVKAVAYDVWFTDGFAELYIKATNSYKKVSKENSETLNTIIQ